MLAVVALHVFPPAIFALMHGTKLYQWRGSVMFVALCVVVANIFENLSILTGFPFGHYHFTGVMGPKLFSRPHLAWTRLCGNGLPFMDSRSCNLRKSASSCGVARRYSAVDRQLHHGRLGLFDGPSLGNHLAQLDLAARGSLLRRAYQ